MIPSEEQHGSVHSRAWGLNRKRSLGAILPARVVNVVGRFGAGSFEPTLWSTLMLTRGAACIAGSRF